MSSNRTPDFDEGYHQGYKQGWNDAIQSLQEEIFAAQTRKSIEITIPEGTKLLEAKSHWLIHGRGWIYYSVIILGGSLVAQWATADTFLDAYQLALGLLIGATAALAGVATSSKGEYNEVIRCGSKSDF